MKYLLAIAAGAFLTACATTDTTDTAQAAETAAPAETQEASGYGDDDRVCTRETATGSRLPARTICRTQAEWDEIERRSQETTREMQRGPQQSPFEGE